MELDQINNRICAEFSEDVIIRLSDFSLMDDYKKQPSVAKNITELENILNRHITDSTIAKAIITDYIPKLIPPGTKGVIRGNKFNYIIRQIIEDMELDLKEYEICFEKQCNGAECSEKPDWFIKHNTTGRVLIGMNQMDLWTGGAQINRGSKYILESKHTTKHPSKSIANNVSSSDNQDKNDNNNENDNKNENENENGNENNRTVKLLCVVCSKIELKSKKNKIYKLFEKGFTDNTLCYPNGIIDIIKKYFDIIS
jgi:hypothetical protein